MANTSKNLPSTALNQSRWGNIAVGNIAGYENTMECDTEEMILDARVDENGNWKYDDLEKLQNHGEKMVRMNNKSSEAKYKCYQNLWHNNVCRKKLKRSSTM